MLRTDRTQATTMQCCLPRLHGRKELTQHRDLTTEPGNFGVPNYAHKENLFTANSLSGGVLFYCRPSSGGRSTAVLSTAAPVAPP